MLSAVPLSLSAALSAETIGDPESTRRVYATVVLLVVLGAVMLALAVWLYRRTRPEAHLLAPLEVMDTRRWRRSEPAQRGRELDQKRPPGARPLRRAAEAPSVDSEFDTAQPVRSFDDLAPGAEPAEESSDDDTVPVPRRTGEAADPTPTHSDALAFSALASAMANDAVRADDGDEAPTSQPAPAAPDLEDQFDVNDDVNEDELDVNEDDHVDSGAGLPDVVAPSLDEPLDESGDVDGLDDDDLDDDREPVMPGEGLLRRQRRDPSS